MTGQAPEPSKGVPGAHGSRWLTPLLALVLWLLLAAVAVALLATLINLWPLVDRTSDPKSVNLRREAHLFWGLYTPTLNKSTALLFLATIMGAIGAFVHAATSLALTSARATSRSAGCPGTGCASSWGARWASSPYFVVRGGFLTAPGWSTATDAYGIVALAALAGLLSTQLTKKLEGLLGGALGAVEARSARRDGV